MGKVGSKSIHSSLKKIDIPNNLFHTHTINYLSSNPNIKLLYNYLVVERKPAKFITLVRDPIARNISSFFEMKHIFLPQKDINKITPDDLTNIFFDKFHHTYPLLWFEIELRQITGINIFKSPFSFDKNYQIIKEDSFEILILKAESDDIVKQSAISEFLNLNNFSLSRSNITGQKNYSDQYKKFQNQIHFSQKYIDEMYNSNYTKHFYSEKEIFQFINKWKK